MRRNHELGTRSASSSLAASIASGALYFGVFHPTSSRQMTVNVPWSTLRPNPRDQRERAAAPGDFEGQSMEDDEPEIHWDVTEFGKRMAFGSIVSQRLQSLPRLYCGALFLPMYIAQLCIIDICAHDLVHLSVTL